MMRVVQLLNRLMLSQVKSSLLVVQLNQITLQLKVLLMSTCTKVNTSLLLRLSIILYFMYLNNSKKKVSKLLI
ncbi:Uncharacterised protein [Mycobacteroides abscessus subsp. abscessus]|nr:Uncharacterised protein [Mycobacteroides abscessus subsp. abscessus]